MAKVTELETLAAIINTVRELARKELTEGLSQDEFAEAIDAAYDLSEEYGWSKYELYSTWPELYDHFEPIDMLTRKQTNVKEYGRDILTDYGVREMLNCASKLMVDRDYTQADLLERFPELFSE